jgi:radical SAM protein with 4Fe4S-binding SPASM domain
MQNEMKVALSDRWYLKNCNERKMLFNNYSGVTYTVSELLYRFLAMCDGTLTLEELVSEYDCKDAIKEKAERLFQLNILKYSEGKRTGFVSPVCTGELIKRLTIHITSKCNLHCKHCYVGDMSISTFSIEELGAILEEAYQMNVLNLSLTGGEPFLYPVTIEFLIEKCLKYGMRIENIFTNANLLENTRGVVNQLIEAFDLTFYVSVDGLYQAYDGFRGKTNAFHDLCSGLDILEGFDAKLFINVLLNKSNLHQLLDIYTFMKKYHSFKRLRISNGFNLGNWVSNRSQYRISMEEEISGIKELIRMWVKDGKPCEMEYGHLFRHLFGQTYLIKDIHYTKDSLCCEYYKNVCVIFPDGSVTPCGLTYPHYVCGSIHSDSLAQIWNSPKMRKFKELKISDLSIDDCNECKYLPMCGTGCRGKALLNGKGYLDIDDTICSLYKHGIYDDFESFVIKEVIKESV